MANPFNINQYVRFAKPSFPRSSVTRMLGLGKSVKRTSDASIIKKAMTRSQEVLKSSLSGPQYRRSLSTQFRGFRRR